MKTLSEGVADDFEIRSAGRVVDEPVQLPSVVLVAMTRIRHIPSSGT